MSKRIVCVLLALIMLVGLIPAGVITASAASNRNVSENAVKFIKDWEGYSKTAYADGSQYTYGYGTKAPNAVATITESEADVALREELKEINAKVNQFAAAHNLNLSQSQHDALVSFSFNVGPGWMSQLNYRITKAVINGARGNDFLQAMCLWSNVDSIPVTGLVSRRMAEADMYLNGRYEKYARASYTYVKFDANGGVLGEDKVQAYDYNSPVTITAVPTREGYTFLGWYLNTGDDASWVGVLNKSVAGKTLYARWQDNNATVEDGKVIGTKADYTISGLNFASNQVYAVPNSNNPSVETINQNDTFKVTAEFVDNSGEKWLKINSGWVKLGEIKVTATTNSGSAVTVTVTNDYINIRKEPNTDPENAPIGTVHQGDKLTITAVREVKGALWGQFDRGWVALMYTNYSSATNGSTGDGNGAKIADGTVLTNATNLNVRTGAGLDYGIVGNLARDTKVEIFEIVTVNGHGWGRIGAGRWVCLDYVNYKKVATTTTQVEVSNGPVTVEEPYKFKATVLADGLNIYSDPTNNNANPIGSLNKNDNVNILDMTAYSGIVFGRIITKNMAGWIQLDKTTYTASGTVSVESGNKLIVREQPDSGAAEKARLSTGTAVTILEIRANGDKLYGRVNEGWINLDYVKLNTTKAAIVTGSQLTTTTTTTTAKVIYTGIVNSGINLNVRLGAGVNYDVVHSLTNGTEVKVYDKAVVNGHYWGKLGENAWICLTYVTETTNNAGENGSTTDGNTNTSTSTGTASVAEMATVVNCTTGVNIRSTPSVGGALLGSAALNSRVKVLETTVYNGSKWARTEAGWISMLYLKLDSEVAYSDNSSVSVNGLFSATVLVNQLNVYDALENVKAYGETVNGTVVTTMAKGASAYVSEVQVRNADNSTIVSGKVTVNGKTGWIHLGDTTFTARGQVKNTTTLRKEANPAADTNGTLSSGASITILDIRGHKATGDATTTLWGKISLNEWVNLADVNLVSTTASTPSNSTVTSTGLGKIAYTDTVNVRKAAGTNHDIITMLNRGTEVVLYEETVVDEAVWCRISTASVNGWVAKDYIDVIFTPTTVQNNNTNNENNTVTQPTVQTSNYATGIVNSNIPLKIRQTPDINAQIMGELPTGTTITIYEQRRGGSMDWGRVDKGWVSLSYVTLTSTGSSGTGEMATIIKAFNKVNVRADATTESAIVGEILVNSRVEVLDQKFVNGYTWYRISNGWIFGDYVQLDAPFVGNQTNNDTTTNTDTNTNVTGPQDEVGGMYTTAILQPRVDDVVFFYSYDQATNKLDTTTYKNKLVKGETVVITGLKAFGMDIWANTKHGWFNLTKDSINFTAVGKVNTPDKNYLKVYSEAGKTGTEPVDKIRDQASITITGVAVNGGKLWGKTANGWVDLHSVELTCTKDFAAGNADSAVTQPDNIADIYKPVTKLFVAKPKDQHLSIAVYKEIGGSQAGIIKGEAEFWIDAVKANGTEVWGAVGTTQGNYWVKLSDVTYNNINTQIVQACYATTSAGGTSTMTKQLSANTDVAVNNLKAHGNIVYAQLMSGDCKDGWVRIDLLKLWAGTSELETPVGANGYFTTARYNGPLNVYDKANGNVVGTLLDASIPVQINQIKAAGGIAWGKTNTNFGHQKGEERWVKMSDVTINKFNTKASVNCSAMTEAGGTTAIDSFRMNDTVTVVGVKVVSDVLYAQVEIGNNTGWVKANQLELWKAMPEEEATVVISGARFIVKNNGAINLYDKIKGNAVATIRVSTDIYVTQITVQDGVIWAETKTNKGTRWVKAADLMDLSTKIATKGYPTTSAGGSTKMTTEFKPGDPVTVSISSMTYTGGNYYVKITSSTNNGGWVNVKQLTNWTAQTQVGLTPVTSGSGVISKTTAKESSVRSVAGGGTDKIIGYTSANAPVLVTDITITGGDIWVKIPVSIVDSNYDSTQTTGWMPYSNLNSFSATAVTDAALNVRESMNTSDSSNILGELANGTSVQILGLGRDGFGNELSNIWAQVNYNGTMAWVNASHLVFNLSSY